MSTNALADKKQVGRKKKSYATKQIRIAEDLADDIQVVAVLRGMDAPDYLTQLLRPIIEKELQQAMKDRQKRKQDKPTD